MIESFGEWLPDLPALNNPGCTEVINLIPTATGYREIDLPERASSTGLTGRCLGAYNGIFDSDSVIFAGDATKLYSLTSYDGAWNDDAGATYTSIGWDFAQFGSLIIAVDGGTSSNDTPQVWDMSTDVPGTDNWGDLGGSPPNAATVAVIGQFVVMGCTYDATDGEVEDRVRWSGYANASTWAVSAATQADIQDLNNGGGKIQKITSNNNTGWVYQERAINRMEYVGGRVVFNFTNNVFGDLGTPSGKSVVTANGIDYLWSTVGFISIAPNGEMKPIGTQKVDRYFADALGTGEEMEIIGAHDPANNSIVWLYGQTKTADTQTAIAFNYKLNRWFSMSFTALNTQVTLFRDAQYVFTAKLGDQTEEKLYVSTGDASTPNYGVYTFEDKTDSMLGTVTTKEYEFNPGGHSMFGRLRLIFDRSTQFSLLVNALHRSSQNTITPTSMGMSTSLRTTESYVRANDKYHRFQFVVSANDLQISGVDFLDINRTSRF